MEALKCFVNDTVKQVSDLDLNEVDVWKKKLT